MIYRVHRPHNPDGSQGSFVGYVNFCSSNPIDRTFVHQSLLESKIISDQWFTSNELHVQSIGALSHAHAYKISKRAAPPGQNRQQLFFLYPIDSPDAIRYSTVSGYGNLTWDVQHVFADAYMNQVAAPAINLEPIRLRYNMDDIRAVEQAAQPGQVLQVDNNNLRYWNVEPQAEPQAEQNAVDENQVDVNPNDQNGNQ